MELDIFQEDEPTVLEYARFHGLSTDYALDRPQLRINETLSDEAFIEDMIEPPDALHVTSSAYELTREPLGVSKEAVLLLKAVYQLLDPTNESRLLPDRRLHILGSKQEVPLLRSDNELDMLQFGSAATPRFDEMRIPLEPVDDDNDEGLEWPSSYSAYPAQCCARANSEKLEITRDTLHFLQNTAKDDMKSLDIEEIIGENSKYQKSMSLQPLTPPLLPLTPPMTPYIPSSPANNLPLLSESSNSTAVEAQALGRSIMGTDALPHLDFQESITILLDEPNIAASSPTSDGRVNKDKREAENWKVEGPLTPPMFSESPAKRLKSVSFSAMVQFIPELPSTYESGDDVLCPEDDFAGFYHDEAIEETNWQIDNEKLSEADTTKRVDIPYVEMTPAVAPWSIHKNSNGSNGTSGMVLDAQIGSLAHIKRNLIKGTETWHGVSKLDRELCWDPMPACSTKVTIVETLHGDDNFSALLTEMNQSDIVTSSSSIWQRDRLRILENSEDEEEELELAESEQQKHDENLSAVVRKRKLELEEADVDAGHGRKAKTAHPLLRDDSLASMREVKKSHHWSGETPALKHRSNLDKGKLPASQNKSKEPHETSKNLMFGGKFSASTALENFMALQGMSVEPSKANKHHSTASANLPTTVLPAHSRGLAIEPAPISPHMNTKAQHAPDHTRRLPSIPKDLPPCSYIISSALLQQRNLSKPIEQLYPNAEFVSRDFDLPHSAAKEADLVLSPSTGLVLTTLQQVKQRALPGQPDCSPTKERVLSLQFRYERLVVVITEGLNQEMVKHGSGRPVDPRDQEAVNAFKNFAYQLEIEVITRYIPGGEQSLACSIVQEMATYGLPHGSKDIGDIKPLPDETNWELFLRRAGLNPFAAQVILALLKDTIEHPLPTSSPMSSYGGQAQMVPTFGLQTFLMMPAEQRVHSFQAVLGGSRVLRRVCRVLDMEWVSAAHGFRM